jgi:large subunit ribosomal protein L4
VSDNAKVFTAAGEESGTVTLDEKVFGAQVNVPVMHQVVTAQLATARAGTHSTKRRGEVRGGGKKPWRQKGTGRARQGSIRAPHWVGGGVVMGPKPRDHTLKVPKKMKNLALRSALTDRARSGRVAVVEELRFEAPKTKDAVKLLAGIGASSALVVLGTADEIVARSFRNLPDVHVITADQLNTYDVIASEWIVFTSEALAQVTAKRAARGKRATAGDAENKVGGDQS